MEFGAIGEAGRDPRQLVVMDFIQVEPGFATILHLPMVANSAKVQLSVTRTLPPDHAVSSLLDRLAAERY